MAAKNLQLESEGSEEGNWDNLAPEILEVIFCQLPVKDLLSCSVVSKNFKKAARDVLKRKRECYFHIKDFRRHVENLNEMIASTGLMEMINGLHIRNEIKHDDDEYACASLSWRKEFRCSKKKLEKAKQKVGEVLRVPWRHLNLDIGSPGPPVLSSADNSLLKEVIFATSSSLEKLVIGGENDWKFIPCNDNEYSKLKVVQLLNNQDQDDIDTQIFSPTFAPKLEEIAGGMIELKVSEPLHCFRMKRMKSILIHSELEVPEGESKEAFGYISGLRKLDLQGYHYEDDPDQQQDHLSWNEFVFPFVLRSLDTLEELYMYTVDFYNLFKTSEALKLPNLRHLSLATNSDLFIETEIPALKQVNLVKLCPKLEKVVLLGEDSFVEVETELIAPLETCAGLYQSAKPMHIDLDCMVGTIEMHVPEYLTFFNELYPNLTQVRILNLADVSFLKTGSMIWEMNSLEYLEIDIEGYWIRTEEFSTGLDALLCGINIEEAKLLFEERRKKNATMNLVIVPIRPSFFNAKKLKELKITEDVCAFEPVGENCVIRIMDNIPVRHERELKVTLVGSENFFLKLKQLRAFSGYEFIKTQ